MQNPFSWDYLTAPASQTPVWGPFSIAYLIFFGLGFVLAITMYNDVGRRFHSNRLLYRTVTKGASIAMAVFGLGLLFFLFRVLEITAFGLHMRIWLYLMAIIAVAMIGYFVYYLRTVYPKKVSAFEAQDLRRRYLEPRGGSSRSGGSSRRRSRKKKRSAVAR